MIDESVAPPNLVSTLLKLGRLGSHSISAADAKILARYAMHFPAPDFWIAAMDSMSAEDKVFYFKGALLAERDHGWGCGSVAAVIWIDARLRRDGIPSAESERRELADWARANRAAESFFRP